MCKNFRHLRALLLVGSVVTALAILAIPSAACAQDAGTSAAIVTIKEAANGICGTVKQEGNSTDMGANGTIGGNVNLNVGGFLKNLIGKLIEGSASISGAWKDEYYQGVLRGQLAAVINKNTDCRMEVLNLLSGSLLHTTIVPDRGLCPQGPGININVYRGDFEHNGSVFSGPAAGVNWCIVDSTMRDNNKVFEVK